MSKNGKGRRFDRTESGAMLARGTRKGQNHGGLTEGVLNEAFHEWMRQKENIRATHDALAVRGIRFGYYSILRAVNHGLPRHPEPFKARRDRLAREARAEVDLDLKEEYKRSFRRFAEVEAEAATLAQLRPLVERHADGQVRPTAEGYRLSRAEVVQLMVDAADAKTRALGLGVRRDGEQVVANILQIGQMTVDGRSVLVGESYAECYERLAEIVRTARSGNGGLPAVVVPRTRRG